MTIPRISIISFCLNSAPFLRQTIASILGQSYPDYELVIKDGGSVDGTIEILKEHPSIRWISEREGGDNPVLEAIWQAFHLSRGEYIIFLAVSDGLMDRDWLRKCAAVLDNDPEVSSVWGLTQHMSEEGNWGPVVRPEFLQFGPPQKRDFLPFWLAFGYGMESNACFRREVFRTCFPMNHPDDPYRFHSTLGFNYRLNTSGYLPAFIPTVSYFGRTHEGQFQEKHRPLLDSITTKYTQDRIAYRKNLLSGRLTHYFRDGCGKIIGEVSASDLSSISRKIRQYRIRNKIRRDLQKLLDHISY